MPGPTYALSFLFDRHPDAQLWTRLGFTFGTVITFFVSFLLSFPLLFSTDLPSKIFTYIAMVFPPFAFARGFSDIGQFAVCSPYEIAAKIPCTPPSAWGWDIAGAKLLYMAASVPLWMAILMLIERRGIPSARPGAAKAESPMTAARDAQNVNLEDDDVMGERARVRAAMTMTTAGGGDGSSLDPSNGIVTAGLRKVFNPNGGAARKVAVADLWMSAGDGEIQFDAARVQDFR
jgi:hypothetical protein